MPSNEDLIKQAEELAKKLKIKIATDDLNNQQLAALVSDLKAKDRDAELRTQADDKGSPLAASADGQLKKSEARAEREKTAATVTKKKPAFYVAPGKAITSKKGVRSGDDEDEVTADMLPGGKETLARLVESGHIIKS